MSLPGHSAAGTPLLGRCLSGLVSNSVMEVHTWWHLAVQVALLASMLRAGGARYHANTTSAWHGPQLCSLQPVGKFVAGKATLR